MIDLATKWESMSDAKKLAIKTLCENDFLFFQRFFFAYLNPGLKWKCNWFHKYIAQLITEVVTGKRLGESLIINIPPGSGKTEIFSIAMQAWSHCVTERLRMLNISYSDGLGKSNAGKVKRIINSEPYQWMWPFSYELNQADEFYMKTGKMVKSEYIYRTMFGGITGKRGGHLTEGYTGAIVLDDPDKPEDMFSKVKREKQHRVMGGTVKNRRGNDTIENPTPFIIVQQRLHVMDTTGFIMHGGPGGKSAYGSSFKYQKVAIPALVDQDFIDALPDEVRQDCIDDVCSTKQIDGYWSFFPEKYSVDILFEEWETDSYTFLSQRMQRPVKLGGNMFAEGAWVYYGEIHTEADADGVQKPTGLGADIPRPPTFEYRFITGDTAQKTKEVHDFSVFIEWGVWQGRVYLLNMLRGKWVSTDLRRVFKDFAMRAWDDNGLDFGNLRSILIEDKSSGTGLIQDLEKELPLPITPLQRSTDKFTRASDVKPHIDAGKVCLPFGEKWVTTFVAEHSEFTADDTHKHDDIVDNTVDAVTHALINNSSRGAEMMKNFYKNRR